MTTVTYANGIMASDGQITIGNHIILSEFKKVFNINKLLLGFTGSTDNIAPIKHYIENCKAKEIDTHTFYMEISKLLAEQSEVLVFKNNLVSVTSEGYCTLGDKDTIYSTGSGAVFARTALELGYNAIKAVEVASNFDIYTNHNIYAVSLDGSDQELEI